MTTGAVARDATSADDEAVAALIGSTFASNPKADPVVLRWQYRENPFGPTVGRVWVDEGEVVAHYSAFAMPYLLDGAPALAANAVDAAVAPSHQGQRLFTPMARELYQACHDAGMPVAVCYASNPIAMHGVARAGVEWQPRLRTLVLAVDPSWLAQRFRLPTWSGATLRRITSPLGRGPFGDEVTGPPRDIDDLWRAVVTRNRISNGVDRGEPWWTWRYARSPLGPYRFVEVRREGRLTGAAAISLRDAFGGRFAYLLELQAIDPDSARAALRTVAAMPGISGIATVAVEDGPLHRLATAAGMRTLPKRLEPKGGAWYGLKDTTGSNRPFGSPWHVGWGDMDHL